MSWFKPDLRSLGSLALCVFLFAGCSGDRGITLVTPPAPVAASLVANLVAPAPPLARGGTFTLTPTYSAGTGRLDNGVLCPPSGEASVSITADWSGPRTYTLTVTNIVGTVATKSVTVTPTAVVVAAITPATPTMPTGSSQVFSTSVTGGTVNTVVWSSGAIGVWSGNTWTAPATKQSVTITATSVDDPSRSASTVANVVEVPVATSLVAAKTTITTGSSTTLTPAFTGGLGKIGTTGPGSFDLTPSATSETAINTGVLTASKAYTLTVSNTATPVVTVSITTNVTVVAAATGAHVSGTRAARPGVARYSRSRNCSGTSTRSRQDFSECSAPANVLVIQFLAHE